MYLALFSFPNEDGQILCHLTQNDCILSANPFTNSESNDRSNEASDIVNGSNSGENIGSRWSNKVVKLKKILTDNNTTSDDLARF